MNFIKLNFRKAGQNISDDMENCVNNSSNTPKKKFIKAEFAYICQFISLCAFGICIPESYIQREYRLCVVLVAGALLLLVPMFYLAIEMGDKKENKDEK